MATCDQKYADTLRLSCEIESVCLEIKDLQARNRICQIEYVMDEKRNKETSRKLQSIRKERERELRWVEMNDDIDRDTVKDFCKAKNQLEKEISKGRVIEQKKSWYAKELRKLEQDAARRSDTLTRENLNNSQITSCNRASNKIRNLLHEANTNETGCSTREDEHESRTGFLPDIHKRESGTAAKTDEDDRDTSRGEDRNNLPAIVPKPPDTKPENGIKRAFRRIRKSVSGKRDSDTDDDTSKAENKGRLPVIPKPPATKRDCDIKRFCRNVRNIIR